MTAGDAPRAFPGRLTRYGGRGPSAKAGRVTV
jgi:hypothetical protein